MLYVVVSATFEDVDEAIDIALDICLRIGDRVTDSSLSTEINNNIESTVCKEHLHRLCVFEIHADEAEPVICGALRELIPRNFVFGDAEVGKSSEFQLGIVITIDIVETDNRVALIKQPPAYSTADKSGSPCY